MKQRPNMKNLVKVLLVLAATVGMASCGPDKPEESPVVRQIIYAVGGEESQTTLRSEAEWDELLDRFCDYAAEGNEVAFYNLTLQGPVPAAKGTPLIKDATTIATSDRTELKAWMKQMEKAGKTVNVTYDDNTGVWHGMAYATAPNPQPTMEGPVHTGVLTAVPMPALAEATFPLMVWALVTADDSTLILMRGGMVLTADMETVGEYAAGDTLTLYGPLASSEDIYGQPVYFLDLNAIQVSTVVGRWRYTWRAVTTIYSGQSVLLSTDVYEPSDDGNDIYLQLNDDGTAVYTSGSHREQSTWSLGDNGTICCELFDGGGCWNISWLSGSTMILSRDGGSDGQEGVYYQMMFEAVAY